MCGIIWGMKKNKDLQRVLVSLVFLVFVIGVFFAGVYYSENNNLNICGSNNKDVGGDGDRYGGSNDSYEEVSLEPERGPEPEVVSPTKVFALTETDVVRGNSDILLIEYSDLDCPFCARFHETAQDLVDSGEVSWVYRHLPLSFHPNADEGATLAECVRIRKGDDEFLSYIDTAFSSNTGSVEDYKNLGLSHGLTSSDVDSCLSDGSVERNIVSGHVREAGQIGVNGTPGSFIVNTKNNKYVSIPGALPVDQVRSAIARIK